MTNLTSFTRWSGLASMVGGLLFAVGIPLHPLRYGQAVIHSPYSAIHVLIASALTLALFGLTGLYVRQADHLGTLGLLSFFLAFVGHAMVTGGLLAEGFLWPAVGMYDPASVHTFDLSQGVGRVTGLLTVVFLGGLLLFAVGYALLGRASMRAGILPRWAGLFIAVGAVLYAAGGFSLPVFGTHSIVVTIIETSGAIPFGLGLIWMGSALWTERTSHGSLRRKVPEMAH